MSYDILPVVLYSLLACCILILRTACRSRRCSLCFFSCIAALPPLSTLYFIAIGHPVSLLYPSTFLLWILSSCLPLLYFLTFTESHRSGFDPPPVPIERAGEGTALLNHTIKNEVDKIHYIAQKVLQHSRQMQDESTVQYMGHILVSVQHMEQMIHRTHSQTREIILHEVPVRLGELIRSTASMIQVYAEQKQVQLRIDDPECDTEVWGDPLHLKEVFINLCRNAIEAVEGGTGELSIRLIRGCEEVCIEFEDNGTGIREEHLNRVQEPYFSTKQSHRNHGLGLSYCSRVIQKHGAFMQIQSKWGEGTTIKIRFPSGKLIHSA